MARSSLWFLCVILTVHYVYGVDYQVNTDYGTVRGKLETADNFEIVAFRGIPYARPPVDSLRFQPPQIPLSWNSPPTGENEQKICPQIKNRQIVGEEDCLYLDIYVPKQRFDQYGQLMTGGGNLPVVILIPGFNFQTGDKNSISPGRALMNANNGGNILAVMNYRLGPLGFLSSADANLPANLGLMDQQMAMEFVFKHVQRFGGDAQRVILVGFAAGGMSASFHLFNSRSRSFFNRAIISGGSATSPDASTPTCYHNAYHFSYQLGCNYRDTGRMRRCLQTTSLNKIMRAVMEKRNDVRFVPCVDGNFSMPSGAQAFISKPVRDLYYNTRVDIPVLYGYPVNAGNFAAFEIMKRMRDARKSYSNIRDRLNDFLHQAFMPYEREAYTRTGLIAAVTYPYFQNTTSESNMVQPAVEMMTDYLVGAPVDYAITKHIEAGSPSIFMYLFDPSKDSRSIAVSYPDFPEAGQVDVARGAFVDDFLYAVNSKYSHMPTNQIDNSISDQLKGVISSFIQAPAPTGGSQAISFSGFQPLTSTMYQYGIIKDNTIDRNQQVSNYGYIRYRQNLTDFWNYLVNELSNQMNVLGRQAYDQSYETAGYKSATWAIVAVLFLLFVILGLLITLVVRQRRRLQRDEPSVTFKAVPTREETPGRM